MSRNLRLAYVLFGSLLVSSCSTDGNDQGYCGSGFAFEDEFSKYETGEQVHNAQICVFTDSPTEPHDFTVHVGAVSGSLVIDGAAGQSTLKFPALTTAQNIIVNRCHLLSSDFPVLGSLFSLALGCTQSAPPV